MDHRDIVPIARQIAKKAEVLDRLMTSKADSTQYDAAAVDELWNHSFQPSDVEKQQSELLGLIQNLNRILRGPHGFLYELVTSNWDKGALYCLLEHGVFEHIPLNGEATLAELSKKTRLPSEKLLPMLRLAACEQMVLEPSPEIFSHGLMSRAIVSEPGLKAFLGFQLYETRIASAHLADSLKQPNPTWAGNSAFEYAWGKPMYEWHKDHPEKSYRFQAAMTSVADNLDPGNHLLDTWLSQNVHRGGSSPKAVSDVIYGHESSITWLFEKYPYLRSGGDQIITPHPNRGPGGTEYDFKQRDPSWATIYMVRSVLWKLPDEECCTILQKLIPLAEANFRSVILVNDLLSPPAGTFAPHVDKAYRRRDVTVMTMHNAKLRTQEEWLALFLKASTRFTVRAISNALPVKIFRN
ncbi:Fc.00g091830.m01.CDS01 [Cosmosporella sp. VM-42]